MSSSSSKPPSPGVHQLQQPEKLSNILKEDKDDCLSCRLVGLSDILSCQDGMLYLPLQQVHRRLSGWGHTSTTLENKHLERGGTLLLGKVEWVM